MQQVLRGAAATISATFDSAPGATTVTVKRQDGTVVATYTDAAATVSGNVASLPLTPADTATLDTLTATWTSTDAGTATTLTEIVGAVLFTVAEARAFQVGGSAPLASSATYSDDTITAARARITERFERICGVSFIPRYKYTTIAGVDWFSAQLPDRPLQAVRSFETQAPGSSTWTPYTTDQLAALQTDLSAGILTRGSLYYGTSLYTELHLPSLTVRVGYEYGYVYPPEPIREAALIATVLALKPSDVGDRTTSISSEAGTFRLATPGYGRNSWFGIPRVDSVLTDYVENVTGIA